MLSRAELIKKQEQEYEEYKKQEQQKVLGAIELLESYIDLDGIIKKLDSEDYVSELMLLNGISVSKEIYDITIKGYLDFSFNYWITQSKKFKEIENYYKDLGYTVSATFSCREEKILFFKRYKVYLKLYTWGK